MWGREDYLWAESPQQELREVEELLHSEREAKAEEVLATTGGTLVHPYNDVDVRDSGRLRTIAAQLSCW